MSGSDKVHIVGELVSAAQTMEELSQLAVSLPFSWFEELKRPSEVQKCRSVSVQEPHTSAPGHCKQPV